MARLRILTEEEPSLRKTSRTVEAISPRILTLLDDMIQTMRAAEGVGLAAPQIGVLRRIVVIETEEDGLYEMINPIILSKSGNQRTVEGCLSLPGKCGLTDRPDTVVCEYYDRTGKKNTVEAHGLFAKAICHELDHLDGILYSDVAIKMLNNKELEKLQNGENVD